MAAIVLNYINRFTLLSMKDLVTESMNKPQPAAAAKEAPSAMALLHTVTTCKCCGWKGKFSAAQKNYFFHAPISELEFFCPKCSTYLGFISDVPEDFGSK